MTSSATRLSNQILPPHAVFHRIMPPSAVPNQIMPPPAVSNQILPPPALSCRILPPPVAPTGQTCHCDQRSILTHVMTRSSLNVDTRIFRHVHDEGQAPKPSPHDDKTLTWIANHMHAKTISDLISTCHGSFRDQSLDLGCLSQVIC